METTNTSDAASPPPTPDTLWICSSRAQADGLACVVCARDYLARTPGAPTTSRPVGHSYTGSQVMACDGECHDVATALVERGVAVSGDERPIVVTAGGRSEAGA